MLCSRLLTRRLLLCAGLAISLLGSLPSHAKTLVRIGYQKSSTLISLLKVQNSLEKALLTQDVSISWHEFTSGQPLLEALNLGQLDLSADVADTVPVFAQAAGAKLTYFAQETPSPTAQAILVHQSAPLKTLADLKGKKVAVTKASGSHYLLIAALQKAGLTFSDIQPAYLTPADGRAAFEQGRVDAWVTWEPFLSAAQQQLPTRLLQAEQPLAAYRRYYLTTPEFAQQHPQILQTVYAQLANAGDWLRAHPSQAATLLSPLWGNLNQKIVERANQHRSYQVRPVDPASLSEQQQIADAFYAAGLLPRQINARDVSIWQPNR